MMELWLIQFIYRIVLDIRGIYEFDSYNGDLFAWLSLLHKLAIIWRIRGKGFTFLIFFIFTHFVSFVSKFIMKVALVISFI
jgi:hypothetical protein